MATATLHTAATTAGGLRVFGVPWWFLLVLVVLISMMSLLALSLWQQRYLQAAAALSGVVLLGWVLLDPAGFQNFLRYLPMLRAA